MQVFKDSTLTETLKFWTHGINLAAATSCFLSLSINPARVAQPISVIMSYMSPALLVKEHYKELKEH